MQHHASYIRSDEFQSLVISSENEEQVDVQFDKLGVVEVGTISSLSHTKPVDHPRKQVVVRAAQISVEAQNALLKLFEEPPSTTRFVLVVPRQLMLLPTLLSRLSAQKSVDTVTTDAWEQFFSESLRERFMQIDSWNKHKDPAWLRDMQTGLVAWLESGVSTPNPSLQLIAERLHTRGAGNKMLLELLALEEQLQIPHAHGTLTK